ncbi:MAG: flagellar basal body rod protein FlgB [Holophagaceae bacterium]|nr:flagellar basal body rod protein FlgB [Holophagaceae bacterium]
MFDLLSNNDMVTTMDKAMTVASRRLGLVTSNLANIDTPFYKAKDIPFHETLQAMLEDNDSEQQLPIMRTHPSHFPRGENCPMVRTHPLHLCPTRESVPPFNINQAISAYERNDFNDVNLDSENLKLMKTSSSYMQATAFTQSAIKRVLTAIREGAK